jgi:hypothetical protein
MRRSAAFGSGRGICRPARECVLGRRIERLQIGKTLDVRTRLGKNLFGIVCHRVHQVVVSHTTVAVWRFAHVTGSRNRRPMESVWYNERVGDAIVAGVLAVPIVNGAVSSMWIVLPFAGRSH